MNGLLLYVICNPAFVPTGQAMTVALNGGTQNISVPMTSNVFSAAITSPPVSSIQISNSGGLVAKLNGIVGNGTGVQTQQMTDGNGHPVNFWAAWNGGDNMIVILDDQTFGDHR